MIMATVCFSVTHKTLLCRGKRVKKEKDLYQWIAYV